MYLTHSLAGLVLQTYCIVKADMHMYCIGSQCVLSPWTEKRKISLTLLPLPFSSSSPSLLPLCLSPPLPSPPSPPSLLPSLLLPMCLFFSSLHVAWQSQTADLTGYASTGSLLVRSQLFFMWWTLPDSSRVHTRDRYSMCNCSYHQKDFECQTNLWLALQHMELVYTTMCEFHSV